MRHATGKTASSSSVCPSSRAFTRVEPLEPRTLFDASTSAGALVRIDGQSFHGGSCGCGGCRMLTPTNLTVVKSSGKALAKAPKTGAVARAAAATSTTTTTSTAPTLIPSTNTAANASPSTRFNITLTLGGSGVTTQVRAAFAAAAAKWESIITTDLPAASGVDDLSIAATVSPIDGPGKVLGQAGPSAVRSGSRLPIRGFMQFDTADLNNLVNNGTLADVVFHEMGHVLGIGTIWVQKNLVGGTSADPRFLGTNAISAYRAMGGTLPSVPLENTGGTGTAGSHWRETTFANEVMTGYINSGRNPVSKLTIASLADLGYGVDLNAADPYTLPGATPPPTNGGSTGGATGGTSGGTTGGTTGGTSGGGTNTGTTPAPAPTPSPAPTPTPAPAATGVISGRIFLDTNANGVLDPQTEVFAPSRTVFLDANSNGRLDTGERTETTDLGGNYRFLNLAAGRYNVRLLTSEFVFQTAPSAGAARVVDLSTNSGQISGQDFGLGASRVTISGGLFTDRNRDGRYNPGETPLVGVRVYLDLNNNSAYDTDEPSSVSRGWGAWRLDNIPAGSYSLRAVLSDGRVQTSTPLVTFAKTSNALVYLMVSPAPQATAPSGSTRPLMISASKSPVVANVQGTVPGTTPLSLRLPVGLFSSTAALFA